MTKRTYFYKADDFPEIVVNKSGKIKSLAESCQFTLPEEKKVEEKEEENDCDTKTKHQSLIDLILKRRNKKSERIKNAAVLASRNKNHDY
jgi:hypothetical protein